MLHCAAKAGHAEVVQLAIDDYKLDPTACDKVSVCVLGQAVLLSGWGWYFHVVCVLSCVVGCPATVSQSLYVD